MRHYPIEGPLCCGIQTVLVVVQACGMNGAIVREALPALLQIKLPAMPWARKITAALDPCMFQVARLVRTVTVHHVLAAVSHHDALVPRFKI
jgi:hypothetical protein